MNGCLERKRETGWSTKCGRSRGALPVEGKLPGEGTALGKEQPLGRNSPGEGKLPGEGTSRGGKPAEKKRARATGLFTKYANSDAVVLTPAGEPQRLLPSPPM